MIFIRAYGHLIAAGVVTAALIAFVLYYGHVQFETGAESVRAELRIASELAAEQAKDTAAAKNAQATKVDTHVIAKKEVAAVRAATTAVAGTGVRLVLQDRGQSLVGTDPEKCSVERAYSRLLADLLSESTSLLEEGASIAEPAVILIDGQREREAITNP